MGRWAWKLVLCAHFLASSGIRASGDTETQSPLLGSLADEGQDEFLAAHDSLDSVTDGIDAFVEKVLREWHLPGISIAIVRQNKTIAKVLQLVS